MKSAWLSRRVRRGRTLLVPALAASLVGCSSASHPGNPTAADPRGPALEVYPARPIAAVMGSPVRLQAGSRDLTGRVNQARGVEWSSTDPACLTVTRDGIATARRACGAVQVRASTPGAEVTIPVATVLFHTDLEDWPLGTATPERIATGWPGAAVGPGPADRRVHVIDDPHPTRGRVLMVEYPAGAVGPTEGGALWTMPIPGSFTELYASYRVRFGPDFDFVLGGKLPGLGGGTGVRPGVPPTGYDGFLARSMWVAGGGLIQYLYHPDQPGQFGESLRWTRNGTPVRASPDRWYHLEHRVRLNTPGQRDGLVQAWLDGQLVLDQQNLRFRNVESIGVDFFSFATFFGGREARHAARKDETIYFDDVIVSTVRSTVLWPARSR